MPDPIPQALRISLALAASFCLLLELSVGVRAQAPQERLEKAKVLFLQGQDAYQKGELKQALDSFLAAETLVPSAELAYNIGHLYERLGEPEKAAVFLRLYLSRSRRPPADGEQVQERIAGLRKQARAVQETLAGPPPQLGEQALDLFERGRRLFEQKRYRQALAALLAARKLSPAAEIVYNLALTSEKLGRPDEAAGYYRAYTRALRGPEELEAIEKKIRELEAIPASAESGGRPPS